MIKVLSKEILYLPARFHNAWDEAAIGHLAEAKTGKSEFFQNTTRTAGQLTSAAETNRGGVARHLV